MTKRARASVLMLLPIAAAFLAGAWVSWRARGGGAAAGGREVLYYVDPMHPAYRSDKPGVAPDCGMQLEPVYADGAGAPGEGGGSSQPAGTVQISPEKQQLVGVRVGTVEKASAAHTLRLYARVAPDETRVFGVNAALEGSVLEVAPVTTGSRVKKGQQLATLFSNEVRPLVQTFLGAVETYERSVKREGADAKAIDNAAMIIFERLKNAGFSPTQLEHIRTTREVPVTLWVVSPVDGFVLSRNIFPGQKVEKGFEWFRLADLRRVWIMADVFDAQARYVRPGMHAEVSVAGLGKTLPARVADVLPQFDAGSRTLKVRLEAENPGYLLRPDMFVDASLPIELPSATTVPVDAIVDSGLKKTVFVDRGNGFFEPRQVETGWRFGDRVEVVSGLAPGERIVVSGTFLVDSESRLKAAAAGIYGAASKDPVCGMDVDEARARAAGKVVERDGRAHFFCSDQCKHEFERSPERFLAPAASPARAGAAHDGTAAEPAGPAKDPMCGMAVDEKAAAAAGRRSEHGGRAFHFCSDACKRKFDADPARYAAAGPTAAR